jgi:hypothetical protein
MFLRKISPGLKGGLTGVIAVPAARDLRTICKKGPKWLDWFC